MALDDLPTLEVTSGMVRDLSAVLSNVRSLDKFIVAAENAGYQIGVTSLAKTVAPTLQTTPSAVKEVLLPLLNLYTAQKNLKGSPEHLVKVISHSLDATGEGEDADLRKRWDEGGAVIAAALSKLHPDHPLVIASKAYRVATSRQYELVDMRLFTDLRPVFNDAGDSILEAVVTHVLSIDFHDGTDHRVIQFNLDANEIKDLKDLCARAERKGMVIKRDLNVLSWPTTVFREPSDTQE